jgi:hypothetical protein
VAEQPLTDSYPSWLWVLIATSPAGDIAWKLGHLGEWSPVAFELFKVAAMFLTLWIMRRVRVASLARAVDERERHQVRWLTALPSFGMAFASLCSDLAMLQVLSRS